MTIYYQIIIKVLIIILEIFLEVKNKEFPFKCWNIEIILHVGKYFIFVKK